MDNSNESIQRIKENILNYPVLIKNEEFKIIYDYLKKEKGKKNSFFIDYKWNKIIEKEISRYERKEIQLIKKRCRVYLFNKKKNVNFFSAEAIDKSSRNIKYKFNIKNEPSTDYIVVDVFKYIKETSNVANQTSNKQIQNKNSIVDLLKIIESSLSKDIHLKNAINKYLSEDYLLNDNDSSLNAEIKKFDINTINSSVLSLLILVLI